MNTFIAGAQHTLASNPRALKSVQLGPAERPKSYPTQVTKSLVSAEGLLLTRFTILVHQSIPNNPDCGANSSSCNLTNNRKTIACTKVDHICSNNASFVVSSAQALLFEVFHWLSRWPPTNLYHCSSFSTLQHVHQRRVLEL